MGISPTGHGDTAGIEHSKPTRIVRSYHRRRLGIAESEYSRCRPGVTRYLATIVMGVRFLVLTFVANSSRSPLSSIEQILL